MSGANLMSVFTICFIVFMNVYAKSKRKQQCDCDGLPSNDQLRNDLMTAVNDDFGNCGISQTNGANQEMVCIAYMYICDTYKNKI